MEDPLLKLGETVRDKEEMESVKGGSKEGKRKERYRNVSKGEIGELSTKEIVGKREREERRTERIEVTETYKYGLRIEFFCFKKYQEPNSLPVLYFVNTRTNLSPETDN